MNSETFKTYFETAAAPQQVELLLSYVDTCQPEHFQGWLNCLLGDPNEQTEPAAQQPVGGLGRPGTLQRGEAEARQEARAATQEMYGFFSRNLDDAMMSQFSELQGVASTTETGEAVVTVVMSPEWWAWADNLLAMTEPPAGVDREGGLFVGFRVPFSTGAVLSLAIYNSAGGPWVDAFLRLPDGAAPATVNPSIVPTKNLHEPIRLEPTGFPPHVLVLQ